MSLRAGSEKIKDTGATGERLKESVQINASLMTLNKVLRTLSHRPEAANDCRERSFPSVDEIEKSITVLCVAT